jgi:FkbM family methyltransferase
MDIIRPEYFFQPKYIFKKFFKNSRNNVEVTMHKKFKSVLGFELIAPSSDPIGLSLESYGVYDLAVTETIERIATKGDMVMDIGANIGYTTSLLAKKVGATGKVFSYEPVVQIFSYLQKNKELFEERYQYNNININNFALSSEEGIQLMEQYEDNWGRSRIISSDSSGNTKQEKVVTKTLDNEIEKISGTINLLKIDVEGHEMEVFKGGIHALQNKKISNILFEEHESSSPIFDFLESFGYKIYYLQKGLLKLQLQPKNFKHNSAFEPPNYLATIDPKIEQKFSSLGWKSL